jgi:hypothetical protein
MLPGAIHTAQKFLVHAFQLLDTRIKNGQWYDFEVHDEGENEPGHYHDRLRILKPRKKNVLFSSPYM